MIRKFIQIFGTIAFLFASSNAYSFMDNFSVGVSGSIIEIEASGSETLKTNGTVVKESVDNTTGIGSIFAEYSWNGFTFGLDYIPVERQTLVVQADCSYPVRRLFLDSVWHICTKFC